MKIPFNKPFIAGKELYYIAQAVQNGNLSGDGNFTRKCCCWMEKKFGFPKALLVHSGTAALEMAAMLCDLQPGDEVIVPSYTFVSTVNAFVLRGAKPVFVDIRPDTMNMDESQIEKLITDKTKVICPVHYGGVACEMDKIMQLAEKYNLIVVEDAAQGVNAKYNNKYLGTIGHLGCYSFHETKNFISGEGGALVINDKKLIERAEIIREKGTNRSQFFRGQIDKYTWVDVGSSYLASELTAAFLYAQLEEADKITQKRNIIWDTYYKKLLPLEKAGKIKLPQIPEGCEHNAHMFYIILEDLKTRSKLIKHLKDNNVYAVFHYVPLHKSPKGIELCGDEINLPVTQDYADRLLRLPCYYELEENDINYVGELIENFYKNQ